MDAGRRIGKYVLDERIAVGGMAEVWAAHVEGREGFVKPVALKLILESFSGDPELERLFVNEARIAARLQHANLVTVFDFDKVGADAERGLAGRYYIAMERVEGPDLRRLGEAARRAGYVFPVGLALHVAGEILKALRYVHEKRDASGMLGLVHRDVSPHNVLVGAAGEVKLSDFGIAKAREHSARTTKPGNLRGKISYASPEQLGGGPVDHRADQFAAGVTIWELLAGRRLFDGATDLEILARVARCEIPALADAVAGGRPGRGDVAPPVEAVLRRMLATEPARRFPTTAEALSAVLALASYSPDGAPLGELVRRLFGGGAPDRSQTLPLQGSPSPGRADAPTRTMGGATPTRHARRTSEALARSPAAVAPGVGDASAPTADVRTRRRAAGIVATAATLALALGGWLARAQLREVMASRAPSSGVVAAPSVAKAPSVPKREPVAPAVPVAPVVPVALPVPVASTLRAPGAVTDRPRAARRRRGHAFAAPVARPSAAVEPAAQASANGAPIIE